MPSAVRLRALAKRSKDVNRSRRLLSLAAARNGTDRSAAAWIGGMDRQTLRDWVHRFNAAGPDGLFDRWTNGPTPRPKPEQLAEPGPANRPTNAARTPIYSAPFAPCVGTGAALALPFADAEAMRRHLDEIAANVAKSARAAPIFDRAGWRATPNLTPIRLRSRAPELNPVENVWRRPRANWLPNTIFETVDEIVDAACDAWRNLTARPELITAIGMRRWARVGVGRRS